MTAQATSSDRRKANGTRFAGDDATLCAETQGRRIVAALVNDAVEEALGLAFAANSGREDGNGIRNKGVKPPNG